MDNKDVEIKLLQQKIVYLESRISYLQRLLDDANIPYKSEHEQDNGTLRTETCSTAGNQGAGIIKETITKRHVHFFYSYFKGRSDVYSKRAGKPNKKTGKTGYYTQCFNFWKDGICPKKSGTQTKCSDCKNQRYKKLTGDDLFKHLIGEKEDCSDVIGIYPMLPDETCNFLVFDFDNHDDDNLLDDGANMDNTWMEEVNAMRQICCNNAVDVLVERSRSGKGAHIWIFFEEPLPVATARRFGETLLTKGAESVNLKSFQYYDRMLPMQDHMPAGGLGNLVALPLQGQALKNGNSAFIDEEWNAYPNQWEKLGNVKKLSRELVEKCIKEWGEEGVLGILSADINENDAESMETDVTKRKSKEKPWEKKRRFHRSDVEGTLDITFANQIFIEVSHVKSRMQNQIRRLAAFSNPEFYKNQAMGFSVKGTPRIISCCSDVDDYICIPRGCEKKLIQELENADIEYVINDCRNEGRRIKVNFVGKLYPEQKTAAEKMLENDNGVLHAATAFGKTAVGAFLVAKRKVNTLVLVHNKEIMKNWVEDFEKFLEIDEEPPEYTTPTGRIKKRKSAIGRLDAAHNSVTGLIDIVMISSLGRAGEIHELVKNYGLVIMDECHHAAAQTAQEVLQEINAKYVYGLTATPKRDDGQEQKIFMQFGPVRYRYTAKDRAKKQGIGHYVYPRFTRLVSTETGKITMADANKLIVNSDVRNRQIIDDVIQCLEQDRTPLVITKNREHASFLYNSLKDKTDHIFLLRGGRSAKERDALREQMKVVPKEETIVLVATGQYIGEGFNYPRLDTMMLTMPISWEGNVEQYSGRLHRDYETKKEVIIYDYVDTHIKVLENMYHKRLRTYKKIGYHICKDLISVKQETNAIFDKESYKEIYEKDLQEASHEIVISSPGLNEAKVKRLISLTKQIQEKGVKIVVLTLKPEVYPENHIEAERKLVSELQNVGIWIELRETMHEHYAVLDGEIVWYGSMNLLSREKEEDNLMRVVSKEIALELLGMDFGRDDEIDQGRFSSPVRVPDTRQR